jgi:hypothetical protein
MPARTRTETAETREPPGKPQSQIDAEEAPPDDVAGAAAAEYESRVPMAMYETGAPAAETAEEDAAAEEDEDGGRPRRKADDG